MAENKQPKLSEILLDRSAQLQQIVFDITNSREPIIGLAIRYENKATTWLCRDQNNVEGYKHSPLKTIVDSVLDKINAEILSLEKQAEDADKLGN